MRGARANAQSIRSNTKRAIRRCYADEVDLFAVYCPATDGVYVVPIEEATRTVGALRVEPTANGQGRRVRWAAEYELPA